MVNKGASGQFEAVGLMGFGGERGLPLATLQRNVFLAVGGLQRQFSFHH